jgi:pyridoxal phosphate enzyme (YggS family)
VIDVQQNIADIRQHIPSGVTLICVSKFHPAETIMQAYNAGERDFGESRVQELLPKHAALPKDIRWHFIGHLQTNKVRTLLPLVYMIHSVDSLHLLETINREAAKIQRRVKVLLEVHVARETTKSGFNPDELLSLATNLITSSPDQLYPWVEICGIMGIATNTDDQQEWRRCFREIKSLSRSLPMQGELERETIVSMGMSDDYPIAIEEGSTMVRIGSSIFGIRNPK